MPVTFGGIKQRGQYVYEETTKTIVESFEKNDPFDICVFDIMMPGMSGYDMARQVRENTGATCLFWRFLLQLMTAHKAVKKPVLRAFFQNR